MKLIAIVFTEWRDAGYTDPALDAAAARYAAAVDKQTALEQQKVALEEDQKLGDSTDIANRISALNVQIVGARQAVRDALAAEQGAEAAALERLGSHAMVGSGGFQVVSDDGTQVEKVVDANGADLPAGAVYSYQVTNAVAPFTADKAMPAWAVAPAPAATTSVTGAA